MKRKPVATIRRRWSAAVFAFLSLSNAAAWIVAQSPYATELISQNGAYGGASLYNNPNAVLGEPTRIAADTPAGNNPYHISLVQPAQNHDLAGNNILTTLSRTANGAGGFTYGSITVKFDHPVLDDPANPYGIDLNVFGNAFYVGSGFATEATDMRVYNLTGNDFPEPVVISVSPDNINWYTYGNGPYGDTPFPTQGYYWSSGQYDATGNGWTTSPTDFTKPVNPTLATMLGTSSIAAADAMSTYVNSGGGTGIDLASSGFASIEYVRVESTVQFLNGEIDAVADVRPMKIGDALSITPDNVAANTPLYFKSIQNAAHTAVVAEFNVTSGLAKLSTSAVIDSAVLGALPSGNLLAAYQLDVQPLIGTGEITFATNYQLSPGSSYTGSGASLELLEWDGSAWHQVAHTFDSPTGRLIVENWSNPTATFAILDAAPQLAGDYNNDGRVDAADYVAGRKTLGASYFNSQYTLWRANFGKSLSAGSGATAGIEFSAVPEPTTFALLAIAAIVKCCSRGLRPRFFHAARLTKSNTRRTSHIEKPASQTPATEL